MANVRATVAEYLDHCRAANLSPRTLSWYTQKLNTLLPLLPDDTTELTRARLDKLIAEHITDHPQRGGWCGRGYVQVLKQYLHYLEDEELVNPRLRHQLRKPKAPKRLIRTLSVEQTDSLLTVARLNHPRWLGLRDQAILRVMLDTGIRATELCSLRTRDVCLDPSDPHAVVIGKGDKQREVGPLSSDCCRAIRKYLRAHPRDDDEPLFPSRYGNQPMSLSGLEQLFRRLRGAAGLDGEEIHPHVLRHTYAVRQLEAGTPIKTISLLMGHTSVQVTERYLADFEQKRARFAAAGTVHPERERREEPQWRMRNHGSSRR